MPRKPKLPLSLLRIETLSDGKVWYSEQLVNDFNGQEVLVRPDEPPSKDPMRPVTLAAQRKREHVANQMEMLKALIPHRFGPPTPQEPKPKGPVLTTRDGTRHELVLPKKPFRRF